eukprot:2997122-Pyramimonas_sp.AAC.1
MHIHELGRHRLADPHVRPRPRAGQIPRALERLGGPHHSSDQPAQLPSGADIGAAGGAAPPPAPAE